MVTPGGRITPAVTTTGLTLSDGGRAPLAVMTSYGRTLSIRWPGRLPVPALTGDTAIYRNVLPGVNLDVIADAQGGFSDVLVIRDAAAAASPALARLRLLTSGPGLTLSADRAGNLRDMASASPLASPVFTAPAPVMWDSARPAVGARTVRQDGRTLSARSGFAAYSTSAGPGIGAEVSRVPLTVAHGVITMTPPARALTGGGVTYPLDIDSGFSQSPPAYDNSAWTQIDSGLPSSTSDWMESSDLQVGYCDPGHLSGCGSIGVTRSMFQLPIPNLPTNLTVDKANIYLDDVWVANCTSAEPLELWTTNSIGKTTDWNNNSNWNTDEEEESFAGYGNSICNDGSYANDVVFGSASATKSGVSIESGSAPSLAAKVQSDIASNWTQQTFGIRAADESTSDGEAWKQWRQFNSGKKQIYLSITYHTPPSAPAISTSPGGTCKTSQSSEAQIGHDTITVNFTAADNDGDTGLKTTVTIYQGDTFVDTVGTSGGTSGQLVIQSTAIAGWPDGTRPENYDLRAVTVNSWGLPSSTTECYFSYNPAGPTQPTVTGFPQAVLYGQTITGISFTAPAGCSTNNTCPVSYTYQLGSSPPVPVVVNSGDNVTNLSIKVSALGPFQLSVYGTSAAGNPGEAYSEDVTSTPQNPPPDGYYADGSYPDVLSTGTGASPSLWLSQGTGNGTVGAPADIGSTGDGINPGTGGPSDWADAIILHGQFTLDGVEDIMAYYPAGPHAGGGVIVGGSGGAYNLAPLSGSDYAVSQGALCDINLNGCADNPDALVAAGNASQLDTGFSDLIGVLGRALRVSQPRLPDRLCRGAARRRARHLDPDHRHHSGLGQYPADHGLSRRQQRR